jgi:hypothetical protein
MLHEMLGSPRETVQQVLLTDVEVEIEIAAQPKGDSS